MQGFVRGMGIRSVAVAVAAGVLLCGCDAVGGPVASSSGGSGVSVEVAPSPTTVTGRLEATRHVTLLTRTATRPHLVRRCHNETDRVRHTTGFGRKRHTTYTEEERTVCTKVQQGTETYRKVVRPEHWCAELDDVGGASGPDNVWYRVNHGDYLKALGRKPGSSVTVEPLSGSC